MYRWVEHTAELGLELEAGSDEQLFADALAAFAELVEGGARGEPARHRVELEGRTRADLLVAWLEELLFLADAEAFVPERVEELELGERTLRAAVAGRAGSPRPLVKAVTYHDLQFESEGGRRRAYVVLDV